MNPVDLGMIASTVTAAGLFVKSRWDIRKLKAETSKTDVDAAAVIADTALVLLKPVKDELAKAQIEVAHLREQLEHAVREAATLRAENAAYHDRYGPPPLHAI